jgi:hypothetical protein
LRASRLRPGPSFIRVAPCSTVSRGRQTKTPEPGKFHDASKKQLLAKRRPGCEAFSVLVVLLSASSAMWGVSGRLNNTRQVPATRAFVGDQSGLIEERGDACDLSHLCCFASRTQQGSSGALTRHRLLHFRLVCTPLIFQRSYSALVASACAQVVTRANGAANAALGPHREGGRASGGVHQKAVVRLTVHADASGAYQGVLVVEGVDVSQGGVEIRLADRGTGESGRRPPRRQTRTPEGDGQPRGIRPGSPAPISIAVAHLPLRASGSDE